MSDLRTEASVGKISCRLATLDDREAVLDINRNLYAGLDYMPFLFNSYVTDTDRTSFVLEVDGKIVSINKYMYEAERAIIGGGSVSL